jgi:hypothetical protein
MVLSMAKTGRPRINPDRRFPDIVQIIDQAMTQPMPVHLYLQSKSAAIALVHRINTYRKAVRDMMETGVTHLDGYVFRQKENVVEIAERPRVTPFNMRMVNATGKDITEDMQKIWEPLTADGQQIPPTDAMYKIEYKRQFGIDPPSTKPGSLQLDIEDEK